MSVSVVVLFCVAFGYLMAVLYMGWRQERRVFQPKPGLTATPRDIGLAFAEVSLTAADGVRLHAWRLPAAGWSENPLWLLHLHGQGTNLSDQLSDLRFWHDLGFAILALDYRGYGSSEGAPSEEGLYLDARAAWAHLVDEEKVRPRRIVVAGVSLGVSVAAELASRVAPLALVLEGGFTSLNDVAVRRYPWLPARLLLRIGLAADKRVGAIGCPKLFVHSIQDGSIPITLGRKLFERAAPPKTLLGITGRHARASEDGGHRYLEGVKAFLSQLPHDDEVA
jgi:pimeloyl-ACP methyl ester carboxylesterase